jgi:hypothetical protein
MFLGSTGTRMRQAISEAWLQQAARRFSKIFPEEEFGCGRDCGNMDRGRGTEVDYRRRQERVVSFPVEAMARKAAVWAGGVRQYFILTSLFSFSPHFLRAFEGKNENCSRGY